MGREIHINKTYYRLNGEDIISSPKTETSNRVISIPVFLRDEIKEYIHAHYEMPEDARLFPIVARTLQKKMKRYMEKSGVKIIRVHSIRHSHVAYLIHQGVDPLIIKERLGHKDIKMTLIFNCWNLWKIVYHLHLNTYGHLYPSQQKKIADMLDERH